MADSLSSAIDVNSNQGSNQVYQKRLQQTQVASPTSSGSVLAQAFGLLGNTLNASFIDQDKRNEKVGIATAERIVAGQTDEDLHKLSAIEMIGNNTEGKQIQDNPYAVATIEKMRGSYIASQGFDEYNTWRARQPPVKTASEEISRYNTFMQKYKDEMKDTTTNPVAFNKGWNDKNLPNQMNVAGQQRNEAELEYRAIQKGTTASAIGDLVRRSDQMGDDAFKDELTNIFNHTRITWMPPQERVEFAQSVLKELATTTGDFKRIQDIASNVVIGTDREGKELKIGSMVDSTPFISMAHQRTAQLYGENVQKSLKALQEMSIPEQNNYFRNLQATDPDWYNVMSNYRDNMVKYREQVDHKKAVAEDKQRAMMSVNIQAGNAIQMQMRAWMDNQLYDGAGRPVASSKGSLPSIEYMDTDERGNQIKKKFEWDDTSLSNFLTGELQKISQRSDLTEDQKNAQSLTLIQFPPFEAYRNTVKNMFRQALDNASAGKLATSREGWVDASPQLLQTLARARVNPDQFHTAFGDDMSKQAQIIQILTEGSNGDYATGLALYAVSKENMKNKEFVNQQQKQIDVDLTYSNMSGFTDLAGNPISPNMALASNNGAMSVIQDVALALACSSNTATDAVSRAKEKAVKTYKVYEHTLVPSSLFTGINDSNRLAVGRVVLDDFKGMFLTDTGLDPAFINISYMPQSQTIIFQGGGQYKAYNANDITYYGNELLKKDAERVSQRVYDQNLSLAEKLSQNISGYNGMTLDSTGVVGS